MGVSRTHKVRNASVNKTRKKMIGGVETRGQKNRRSLKQRSENKIKKEGPAKRAVAAIKLTKKKEEEEETAIRKELQEQVQAEAQAAALGLTIEQYKALKQQAADQGLTVEQYIEANNNILLENTNIKKQSEVQQSAADPTGKFEEQCNRNSISVMDMRVLFKDKHALDNMHDFTGDRAPNNPYFFYFIYYLFNLSVENRANDILFNKENIAAAIINRNTLFEQKGITFSNLEWDVFKYFSKQFYNRFSCTPEAGFIKEEISIKDLLTKAIPDEIYAKQHIVLNSSDYDPTDDRNVDIMTKLANFYIKFLGLSAEVNIFLNFDAKTSSTFTGPLRLIPNVKQLITYQNLYDSGVNMFSNLSDNTKMDETGFDKTVFIEQANALKEITSNYFTSVLGDRSYKMEYVPTPGIETTPTYKGIANIFDWVKIKVTGPTAAATTILQTSIGDAKNINDLPQRGGPGVGVLGDYIMSAVEKSCKSDLTQNCFNNRIEKEKGFSTVRISELLGKSGNLSDIIKLCVDIKGGGDAEQVNAVWHYYKNGNQCIMVTGDILCYMYAIIMGLPSVLIIGSKIYLSKGEPLRPLTENEILINNFKNELNNCIGLIKTYKELANIGNKLTLLKTNIITGINNIPLIKFGNKAPQDDIRKLITLLIKLKAVDIYNYIYILEICLKDSVSLIGPIIADINTKYPIDNPNYTIDIDITKINEDTLKQLRLQIASIKKSLSSINDFLDNFKNKKFNGDIKSFVNGIITTDFFNIESNTTVQEYDLFNYNRDNILKSFSEVISKIINERPGAADNNPRKYLGKSIRGKFLDFFKTFLTFNMIEKIGITQHYLMEFTAGYVEKGFDIRDTYMYKGLSAILDDNNIILNRNPKISSQISEILEMYIKNINLDINHPQKPGSHGGGGKMVGGNANLVKIESDIKSSIPILQNIYAILQRNNALIIKHAPYKETVDVSIDTLKQRGIKQIEDTFREILQDAYCNDRDVSSSYDKIYNKWNDLRYELSHDSNSYNVLSLISSFDNIIKPVEEISVENQYIIITVLSECYINAIFNTPDKLGIINLIGNNIISEITKAAQAAAAQQQQQQLLAQQQQQQLLAQQQQQQLLAQQQQQLLAQQQQEQQQLLAQQQKQQYLLGKSPHNEWAINEEQPAIIITQPKGRRGGPARVSKHAPRSAAVPRGLPQLAKQAYYPQEQEEPYRLGEYEFGGGTRSYGEKSLTRMLKGMKLNKSKKQKRIKRKTIKKDRK